MFWEDSKRLHYKAFLSETRKASKDYGFSNITIWLYQHEIPSWTISGIWSDFSSDSHFTKQSDWMLPICTCLVGQIYYCCGRALQGQLSKCTQRNSVTAFRALVKFLKGLKRKEAFAWRSSRKRIRPIQLWWSRLLVAFQPATSLKKSSILTRNATRFNNHDDWLHLSFTSNIYDGAFIVNIISH